MSHTPIQDDAHVGAAIRVLGKEIGKLQAEHMTRDAAFTNVMQQVRTLTDQLNEARAENSRLNAEVTRLRGKK